MQRRLNTLQSPCEEQSANKNPPRLQKQPFILQPGYSRSMDGCKRSRPNLGGLEGDVVRHFDSLSVRGKVLAEYIWVGGTGSDLRSKSRVLSCKPTSVDELPIGHFDGSFTGQVSTTNVHLFPDGAARALSVYRAILRQPNKTCLGDQYRIRDSANRFASSICRLRRGAPRCTSSPGCSCLVRLHPLTRKMADHWAKSQKPQLSCWNLRLCIYFCWGCFLLPSRASLAAQSR